MAKGSGKDLLERLVPILLVLTIGLAFAVGILWQRVSDMQGGRAGSTTVQEDDQPTQPANGKLSEAQAENVPGLKEDDHVRGSRDASVL